MKVELHHGDLHELAWLRADGIDMALSAYGLATVTDLPRVLRQVHRVLRQEAPLVLSLPHPAIEMVAAARPTRCASGGPGSTTARAPGPRRAPAAPTTPAPSPRCSPR